MKTSKKILIIFASIIVLFHLSLIFEVEAPEFHETHSAKEFRPEPFSHLKLKDGVVIFATKDTTTNLLMYHYRNGTNPDTSFFLVRNDTLFLKKPDIKGKRQGVNLNYTEMNSITVVNSHLNLSNNMDKNTVIKSTNSQIRILDIDSLQNLNILLRDESRITVKARYLKTANIDMIHSRANLNTKVGTLDADIKKNSRLFVQKAIHSNIQNDESSNYSTK